jgi:putative membrane protein
MSFRSKRIGSIATLAFAVAAAAIAQAPNSTAKDPMPPAGSANDMKMSAGDKSFAEKAAIGGQYEVQAGKLALQKSSDEKVKAFAQRMVDDHSKAGDDLKAAAGQEGITLPTELDGKHKSSLDKLSGLSGAQFDAAYKAQMLKDHKEDVAMFEKEAASGQTAVDKFASSTLPTLKEHLKMAEDLAGGGSGEHSHH